MRITILNLGMGNIGSIPNMLKRFPCEAVVTQDVNEVLASEKLILPGVGAFDAAMTQLDRLGLISALNQKVLVEKVPVLGICLGMQLLAQASEEGVLPGLGWIPGQVVKFKFSDAEEKRHNLKIPHMGWNHVALNPEMALLKHYDSDPRFYFVHSYHYAPPEQAPHMAWTTHGYPFPAMIQQSNILGVQFHPEKSHRFGLQLLENFVNWTPTYADSPDHSVSTSGQ